MTNIMTNKYKTGFKDLESLENDAKSECNKLVGCRGFTVRNSSKDYGVTYNYEYILKK